MINPETKTRQVEPDVTVVEISGRLNMGNALQSIETSVKKMVDQGARKLVVDLTALNYIDSSGIGMLVACCGYIAKNGGKMRIAGAQGNVAKVLEMVHMPRIAPLDSDVTGSCGHFSAQSAAV